MKKLLVLTDFTANAAHAAAASVRLCGKLNTDLLLYHTVQSIPVMPDFSGGPYVTEAADILFNDSKERLNKEAGSLQSVAVQANGYHPEISSTGGEGSLGVNIKMLSEPQDIRLVVMGGRSGGALDHLLLGSATAAVIRDARKPVLIIPETTELSELKKIVFATDFGSSDISAINYLLEMAQQLDVQLEVVHVALPAESVAGLQSEIALREYVNRLNDTRISYKQLSGDRVSQRLQHYCRECGAGLLAMTHAHHDLISRIFGHSESQVVISGQQLAVLIFPPDFK